MFSRVKILARFQAWVLGIWRALTGNYPVDWHNEIDEAVEIVNDALDLREQPEKKSLPLRKPMPPAGTTEQETLSDQEFLRALKRRRQRRRLDEFEM